MLASGELHLEFLDEGGHIAVADHGAFVLLDAEDAFGQGEAEVFLDLHLATQAPAFLLLLAAEEAFLGGKDGAAAFDNAALALATRAFSAAGRGQVDALLAEGGDEGAAGGNVELLVAVDGDFHIALGHELGAQHKQQYHKQEYDDKEDDECGDDCFGHKAVHNLIPINDMKAMPMRPVMMKVMPTPRRAGGMAL